VSAQSLNPPLTPLPSASALPTNLVLAGNPNVGKSVVFQALTGQFVEVSNFPGTTVSIKQGQLLAHWLSGSNQSPAPQLLDAPGVYGLSGLSEEEQVAQQAIESAHLVINVVSAPTLKRDLFLTQQLIDWQCPLLVAVNQLDALPLNQSLDLEELERLLGVPVVGLVATKGQGFEALMAALPKASQAHAQQQAQRLSDLPEAEALRALEADPGQRLTLYGQRRQRATLLAKKVLKVASTHETSVSWQQQVSKSLGQALLHPLWGAVGLLSILLGLYQLLGVWIAGDLVDLLEGQLLLGWVLPPVQQALANLPPLLNQLLAGEFGIITMSLQYIVGVMFPLVLGFYLYLSILEDSGYLPRLAVLADGLLNRVGLNGRALIPLILGLGCVTVATLSTRVLTSQRERTIATALLGITIPCSAQLGVIMGMMALAGGLVGWLFYIAVLVALFGGIGSVLNRLLPGRSTPLLLDLPPMRLPRWQNALNKAWKRTMGFLQEATPLFIMGTALVSVANVSGALTWIEQSLAPITETLLHLPGEAASAFLMGMVRRDFGLAGFYQLQDQLNSVQLMTSLVVITLFVPCVASAAVMWKERGWAEGVGVLAVSWVLAFAVGGVLTRLLEFASQWA
jgi:ferrous iron transport protein B